MSLPQLKVSDRVREHNGKDAKITQICSNLKLASQWGEI